MINLPVSSQGSGSATTKSVPATAPRPTREWLAGRVMTFMAHFFQASESEMIREAVVEDWIEVLRDLPKRSIELAIWERLRMDDRRRPIPGEVRKLALRCIAFPQPVSEPERPKLELVTEDRRAEIAAEVGGIAARAFRSPSELAVDTITGHVCDVFRVGRADVRSGPRKPEICQARFAIAFLLRRHTALSYPQISSAMGSADHTTAMSQAQRAAELVLNDEDFAARIDEVERRMSV